MITIENGRRYRVVVHAASVTPQVIVDRMTRGADWRDVVLVGGGGGPGMFVVEATWVRATTEAAPKDFPLPEGASFVGLTPLRDRMSRWALGALALVATTAAVVVVRSRQVARLASSTR